MVLNNIPRHRHNILEERDLDSNLDECNAFEITCKFSLPLLDVINKELIFASLIGQ